MITHVALFRWKPEIPEGHADRIARALRALVASIPALRTYEVGSNVGDPANYDFAVVAKVDDVDGWREYITHPEHEKVRDELIAPWVAERASLQF